MRLVDEVYTAHPYFGSRQMVNYLHLQGVEVGRTRIRGIYKTLGLQAVCPGPHTSRPHPQHKRYPYLLRGVEIVKMWESTC
jgi:putative transposase